MNLIDLYVAEVGQYLPQKGREDLMREIRSLIEDTVEARSQQEGRPADDLMISAVLKEFGSPKKMAASYSPTRYLIGPRYFPAFLMVMRIVVAIIGILTLIHFGISLANAGSLTIKTFSLIIGENIADFFQSALAALGNVVFVFAVIEYFTSQNPKQEKEKEWDPRSLKARPVTEAAHPVPLIIGIVGSALLILVFNFYPNAIGFVPTFGEPWQPLDILTGYFYQLLPLMTGLWVLQIALDGLLLGTGHWSNATRWFYVALKVFGMTILVLMITGAPIFDVAKLIVHSTVATDLQALTSQLYTGFRSLLVVILVLEGVDLLKMLFKIGRSQEATALPA